MIPAATRVLPFFPPTPGMRVTGSSPQTAPSGRSFTFHCDLLSPVSDFTRNSSVFTCFSNTLIVTMFLTYSQCGEDAHRSERERG